MKYCEYPDYIHTQLSRETKKLQINRETILKRKDQRILVWKSETSVAKPPTLLHFL